MIVSSPNPTAVGSSSLRYALTESPASRSSTPEMTIAPSTYNLRLFLGRRKVNPR